MQSKALSRVFSNTTVQRHQVFGTQLKIAGRNVNNLRYADDTILMAESKELKSLLMKMKEKSEKVDLKLKIKKLRSWNPFPSFHGK